MIDENVAIGILRGAIAAIEQLATKPRNGQPAAASQRLASDSELDSQYGDELVKFKPRDWLGPDCKGAHMSQCQPEFLDRLADAFAYFAQKNDADHAVDANGKPKSAYDRRSERRARGWAARLRNGWTPQKPANLGGGITANDIPWGGPASDDQVPF